MAGVGCEAFQFFGFAEVDEKATAIGIRCEEEVATWFVISRRDLAILKSFGTGAMAVELTGDKRELGGGSEVVGGGSRDFFEGESRAEGELFSDDFDLSMNLGEKGGKEDQFFHLESRG